MGLPRRSVIAQDVVVALRSPTQPCNTLNTMLILCIGQGASTRDPCSIRHSPTQFAFLNIILTDVEALHDVHVVIVVHWCQL